MGAELRYWVIDILAEVEEINEAQFDDRFGSFIRTRLEEALESIPGTRALEVSLDPKKCPLMVSVDDYDPRKERPY